jgi:hypothetical protein
MEYAISVLQAVPPVSQLHNAKPVVQAIHSPTTCATTPVPPHNTSILLLSPAILALMAAHHASHQLHAPTAHPEPT